MDLSFFHGSAQNEKEKSFSFQIWKRFVFNVRFQIRVHTSYKLGFKPLSNFKQVWIQFSKHFETAFKFQANFKLNFKTVSYQISNCFQISNLLEIKSQTSLKSDFKPLSHYKLAWNLKMVWNLICCIYEISNQFQIKFQTNFMLDFKPAWNQLSNQLQPTFKPAFQYISKVTYSITNYFYILSNFKLDFKAVTN